jgi:hypothetical protein
MSCGGEPLRDFLIAYRKEERGIQVQSERRARGETVARDCLDRDSRETISIGARGRRAKHRVLPISIRATSRTSVICAYISLIGLRETVRVARPCRTERDRLG